MKLSTRARYGLRALIDLGLYGEEGPVSLSDIASREGISDNYLEQLMPKLKKAGIVTSSRGAGGGYTLNLPPEEISVGEVLRALEGDLNAVHCPGAVDDSSPACDAQDVCVTKLVWRRINESIASAVDSLMLRELIEESRKNREKAPQAVYACTAQKT